MKKILVIMLFASLPACKTRYIPVESVRTEYKDRFLRDSVYLHDSVFVMYRNDTVWLARFHTLYRDRVVRDSIFHTDTIKIPYPVVETRVENKLNLWQRIIQAIGYLCLGALLGWSIFKLKRFVK